MRRIRDLAGGGLSAVFALASFAAAQTRDDQTEQVPGSRSLIEKLNAEAKPSAPAPKRDLNGAWTGPVDSMGRNFPPFTPLGEQRFKLNKPEPVYHLANTNRSEERRVGKGCDSRK